MELIRETAEDVVKGGLYQHYKGKFYRVIDVVRHSETLEEMVFYECLYENAMGRLWVRPKDLFLGMHGEQKRFQFIQE